MLEIKGGIMEGRPITPEEVASLATLPSFEVVRAQALGAITSLLYAIVGLFTAPLQDLYGLLDARIEQLGGQEEETPEAAEPEAQGEVPETEEPQAEETSEEPQTTEEEQ